MCSVSLQVVGSPLASDTPSPFGPRNWGQLSAARPDATNDATINERKTTDRNMRNPQLFTGGKKVLTGSIIVEDFNRDDRRAAMQLLLSLQRRGTRTSLS